MLSKSGLAAGAAEIANRSFVHNNSIKRHTLVLIGREESDHNSYRCAGSELTFQRYRLKLLGLRVLAAVYGGKISALIERRKTQTLFSVLGIVELLSDILLSSGGCVGIGVGNNGMRNGHVCIRLINGSHTASRLSGIISRQFFGSKRSRDTAEIYDTRHINLFIGVYTIDVTHS